MIRSLTALALGAAPGALDSSERRFTADVVDFGTHVVSLKTGSTRFPGATTLDLSAAWRANEALTITGGVLNATDEYPARVPGEITGRPYSEFDSVGVNGREYYLRLSTKF